MAGQPGKRLVYLIPISMLLGLIAGAVWDVQRLSVLVLPMTMLMVYPMLISFKPRTPSAPTTSSRSGCRW